MKRSDYDTLLSYINDPYQGFLAEKKGMEAAPVDEKVIEGTVKELEAMGYTLYVGEGGALEPRFLVKALEKCEECLENTGKLPELIYCDEDRRTNVNQSSEQGSTDPFFKPDFSPDTLESFFYIGGALLLRENGTDGFEKTFCRKDYLNVAGRILSGFINNGVLFCGLHIAEVLFHSSPEADYSYPEGARPRMIYPDQEGEAAGEIKVRAVILSKDHPELLTACLESFIDNTDVKMDYVVVDNGSNEANRLKNKTELEKRDVQYLYNPDKFIYSRLCNQGAKSGDDNYDYLLLLNDDVILPKGTKGFPSALIRKATQRHVGAVGVKLLFPKGEFDDPEGNGVLDDISSPMRIQHAGIALTKDGPAHKLSGFNDDMIYERGRNRGVWDVMAVTGACLLVSREKFFAVGGFDERLHISYTDVDLCMDLQESGLYNIVMNDIALLHFESLTRGQDSLGREKAARLKEERKLFYEKHPYLLKRGDAFYNVNLKKRGPGFEPDFDLPWEKREISQRIDPSKISSVRESDKLMGSIDSFSFRAASFDTEEEVYEVLGWCICHNADMLKYEPALAVGRGESRRIYEACRFFRKDLAEVFPGEKNVLLSGFICRIPVRECRGEIAKEDVSPALLKTEFWSKDPAVYVMGGKGE